MDNNKKLKYNELMEDLKQQIVRGDFRAGDKLPSENVLSKEYKVSRETVRKALNILGNAGYIYAVHGKGTFCSDFVRHNKPSRNIAVVTTYLSDYIFPRLIQGIDRVLTEHGYSIILKNTRNSRSLESKCLEELLQKDIDGIIIEPSKSQIYCRHLNLYQRLDASNIPYVFIQGCFTQLLEKPKLLLDDCKGGYIITKHLIDLGHKHIVGIFKADDSQGLNRHKGYVQALQEAGMPYNPDYVIWFHTEDRTIHPYESMKRLVKDHKEIDGVVSYNDQIAMEAIRALKECNVSIPEDVSVTGYDNSYLAKTGEIKLTTITHPQEKLGELAAETLIKLIKGDIAADEVNILIDPELVTRDSCKQR